MSRGDAEPDGVKVRAGWRTVPVALALYAVCLAAATYPAVAHLGTRLPMTRPDPLMHLWVMRWYKACALEGRLPFACPEIQSPVGAPLGHFSPMHLQGLLYFPLSRFVPNDVACYNLLWLGGFLFTGMGTFALARRATRDPGAAWLAGLLAMLATPMTVHAVAHLELLYAGGFALFLASWLGFVDRPSGRRLAAAAAALVLMTAGAAYFLVLALPPAALYPVWRCAGRGRAGAWPWLRARLGWLAGFAAAVLPFLALLFSNQLWAVAHGDSMGREFSQFAYYKAAPWAYAVPTPFHALGRLLPFDVYARLGYGGGRMGEGASYLGVVALALLAYAAVRRVRFPRASYWWAALALLVVLSFGVSVEVGPYAVPMPGRWLWDALPVFRLTRNPGRFNLLACQCAAVIAAAGLAHLLARLKRPAARVGVVAALAVAVTADLRSNAFVGATVPPLPAYHRALMAAGARPSLLDVPMMPSGACDTLGSTAAYWQSFHRGRTSAGYSGHDNDRFNELVYHGSPYNTAQARRPDFLDDPDHETLGVAADVNYRDYVWLYARHHGFDRIVLHKWDGAAADNLAPVNRLEAVIRHARVAAGDGVVVHDPARLNLPAGPVLLPTEGWLYGVSWKKWPFCPTARTARMVVYNPAPARALVFRVSALAFRSTRTVRLMSRGRELFRFDIAADAARTYTSPPFTLDAGETELELVCEGRDRRPARADERIGEGDDRPYSLLVSGVTLGPAVDPAGKAVARRGVSATLEPATR